MQMIDRRSAIIAAVGFSAALILTSSSARAQQSFQRFLPLLVDLPGWKGNKPDGISMETGGSSMLSATREYERGDSRLTAQILAGPAAQGGVATINSGMKVETSEARMSTSTIDGVQVAITFTKADKSGVILVALGPSALFSFSFNDLSEEEALALAKRFNWKAIQAAVGK
jgi:hypothetical protein